MNFLDTTMLQQFQATSKSTHQLALSRMKYFEKTCGTDTDTEAYQDNDQNDFTTGFAKELVNLLVSAMGAWNSGGTNQPTDAATAAINLVLVLEILQNIHTADPTLSEEVARYPGLGVSLQTLIDEIDCRMMNPSCPLGRGDASISELSKHAHGLQTFFAEAVGRGGLPFSRVEIQNRLPMKFSMPRLHDETNANNNNHKGEDDDSLLLEVLIQQATTAATQQHDVGFVMWPSSVTLARWITQHPALILESAAKGGILELGAGCGLVGLTAASIIKLDLECHKGEEFRDDGRPPEEPACIFLTDYNPTVLENLAHNIRLNDLDENSTKVVGLDFFDQPELDIRNADGVSATWVDMNGLPRSQVNLVLAADILCYSNDATLVANTLQAALLDGGHAIVVSADETKRFGVEGFPDACRNAGLQVTGITMSLAGQSGNESGAEQQQLMSDMTQTIGFTQEYNYHQIMFHIEKPIKAY